jgi:hypothetical protein
MKSAIKSRLTPLVKLALGLGNHQLLLVGGSESICCLAVGGAICS